MKRTIWMAITAFVLTGANLAAAQSLGDYARNVRKNKPQSSTPIPYYDNDNLPTKEKLSVVGPEPTAQPANAAEKTASGPATAQAEKQKANAELQDKIKEKQAKIDGLTHELSLDQREYRLRAAEFYGDAGNRLRNSAQWDKDDARYKADMEEKQKAIEDAKQQLDQLQEQARKAGIRLDDNAKNKDNNKDQEKE